MKLMNLISKICRVVIILYCLYMVIYGAFIINYVPMSNTTTGLIIISLSLIALIHASCNLITNKTIIISLLARIGLISVERNKLRKEVETLKSTNHIKEGK